MRRSACQTKQRLQGDYEKRENGNESETREKEGVTEREGRSELLLTEKIGRSR